MITLKSIEINPIERSEEKQILLKWNLKNGIERNHLVTIQSPLTVDDVLKALKELQDLIRNDPYLIDEETKKKDGKENIRKYYK